MLIATEPSASGLAEAAKWSWETQSLYLCSKHWSNLKVGVPRRHGGTILAFGILKWEAFIWGQPELQNTVLSHKTKPTNKDIPQSP